LMGIWGLEVQVPLERPAKYKDKEFFTDAEIAEAAMVAAALRAGAAVTHATHALPD